MVEMKSVESSMIRAMGYDEAKSSLIVEFNNGSKYAYMGVPEELVATILESDSVGRQFDTLIKKGGFDYTKVA